MVPTPPFLQPLVISDESTTFCDDGAGFTAAALYGAEANVTLAAGQLISVTATADFGGDIPGPSSSPYSGNLYLNVCYMQGGALVIDSNKFFGPLAAAAGTIQPFTLERSFSGADALAPGTYTVALCACVSGTDPALTAWNTNHSTVEVRVFQQ
jgi:hypothetical protein